MVHASWKAEDTDYIYRERQQIRCFGGFFALYDRNWNSQCNRQLLAIRPIFIENSNYWPVFNVPRISMIDRMIASCNEDHTMNALAQFPVVLRHSVMTLDPSILFGRLRIEWLPLKPEYIGHCRGIDLGSFLSTKHGRYSFYFPVNNASCGTCTALRSQISRSPITHLHPTTEQSGH